VLILSKFPWWNRKCCHDATAISFDSKVRGEVITHFYAVAVKLYSSMQNWLFSLPELILCKQTPWCQRKWWACSWLCSSPVFPISVSVSVDFPCTTNVFFPKRAYNHCQGVCCTFSKICTKFDAVFVVSIAKSHQATYMTPKKGHKN
jgi:hypothetical protein